LHAKFPEKSSFGTTELELFFYHLDLMLQKVNEAANTNLNGRITCKIISFTCVSFFHDTNQIHASALKKLKEDFEFPQAMLKSHSRIKRHLFFV
jgi:hypothetical protein